MFTLRNLLLSLAATTITAMANDLYPSSGSYADSIKMVDDYPHGVNLAAILRATLSIPTDDSCAPSKPMEKWLRDNIITGATDQDVTLKLYGPSTDPGKNREVTVKRSDLSRHLFSSNDWADAISRGFLQTGFKPTPAGNLATASIVDLSAGLGVYAVPSCNRTDVPRGSSSNAAEVDKWFKQCFLDFIGLKGTAVIAEMDEYASPQGDARFTPNYAYAVKLDGNLPLTDDKSIKLIKHNGEAHVPSGDLKVRLYEDVKTVYMSRFLVPKFVGC